MKKIVYILIISVLLTSCTNELLFNIEDKSAKLILNASLEADSGDNTIILAFTGKEGVTYVNDATVNIYVNNQLRESILHAYDNYGRYKSILRFNIEDHIKVEAITKDGLYHAWGETTVPIPIAIEKIEKESITISSSFYENKFIRIKTTFSDNSVDRNYYRIGVVKMQIIDGVSLHTSKDTTIIINAPEKLIIREDIVLTDGRPTPINTDDDNIFDPIENKYGVFDNARINGRYTMTINIGDYFGPDYYIGYRSNMSEINKIQTSLKIKLQSITKNQYYYLRALNIYDSDNYDDNFDLPIKFPSNVNGGTGVVSISSENSVIIQLPDYNKKL